MNNFNPSLVTDLDWVRFLVGDWKDCPQIPDEVITAMLADAVEVNRAGNWNRYFVAAMVLDAMLIQWRASTKGKSAERVSRLEIEYGGTGGHMDDMLINKAKEYRVYGAWLLHPRPRPFAIL